MERPQVVIVGGGFAGLNAAKVLGRAGHVDVTLIDRCNHHLFQPLLYQVAMAALSPADIAAPIRSILSPYRNVRVIQGLVSAVDIAAQRIQYDAGELQFDYLILACGNEQSYGGHEDWMPHAPSLKTIAHATEIRRRVLTAFEEAERSHDPEEQRRQLTFAVVGGGPTGVELAGALGEMSRYTLARDFRSIDAKRTRIFLIEAGPRILPSFPIALAERATRDLEKLGVQVWTSSPVTHIDADGLAVGEEKILAATVIWAAGVRSSELGRNLGAETDAQGRVVVQPDLSLADHARVFVVGDQAHCESEQGRPLPGLAPVALQQGKHVAANILRDVAGKSRLDFRYRDKGQMATIGRNKAVVALRRFRFGGWFAWVTWLLIHIFYLTGFRNRLFVILHWAWSYITCRRGARLIVGTTPDQSRAP